MREMLKFTHDDRFAGEKKPQWNNTLRTLTVDNLTRLWGNRHFHLLMMGMQNVVLKESGNIQQTMSLLFYLAIFSRYLPEDPLSKKCTIMCV